MTIHTGGLSISITARPAADALAEAHAKMAAAWARRERASVIKPFADPLPATRSSLLATRESNLNYAARRCGLL